MRKPLLIFLTIVITFTLLFSTASAANYKLEVKHKEENAQIGQPFPIEYKLTGGSGQYYNLSFDIILCDESRAVMQILTEEVDSAEGVWNLVVPTGAYGIVYFGGKDAETGEGISIEPGSIKILPNPDYPVTFTFDKKSYKYGDTISVDYKIDGTESELIDGKAWWTIDKEKKFEDFCWWTIDKEKKFEDYYLTDVLDPEPLSELSGTKTLEIKYGESAYLTIEGTTSDGYPIFVVSDKVKVEK